MRRFFPTAPRRSRTKNLRRRKAVVRRQEIKSLERQLGVLMNDWMDLAHHGRDDQAWTELAYLTGIQGTLTMGEQQRINLARRTLRLWRQKLDQRLARKK